MSLSLIKMTLHDQIDNIDPPDRFAVISLCLNPPPPPLLTYVHACQLVYSAKKESIQFLYIYCLARARQF